MALNGLQLLYDFFLSLFGNTGLTPLDVAGGRTLSTGTPSANAEASTPTVSHLIFTLRFPLCFCCFCLFMNELRGLKNNDTPHYHCSSSSWFSLLWAVMTVFRQRYGNLWKLYRWFATTENLVVKEFMVMSVLVAMEIPLSLSALQPIRTLWRWCSMGWREAVPSWSVRPALHTLSSNGICREITATAGKRWAAMFSVSFSLYLKAVSNVQLSSKKHKINFSTDA